MFRAGYSRVDLLARAPKGEVSDRGCIAQALPGSSPPSNARPIVLHVSYFSIVKPT
jgi:hypothetical protein